MAVVVHDVRWLTPACPASCNAAATRRHARGLNLKLPAWGHPSSCEAWYTLPGGGWPAGEGGGP